MIRHVSLCVALLLAVPGCKSDEAASDETPATQPSDQPTDGQQPPAAGAVPPGLESFQPVLGKSVADAEQWLQANPTTAASDPSTPVVSVRPVRVDGEDQARTMDMRNDRLNVIVEGGVITGIDGVY